jgi:peptidylprolyl isomerase
MERVEKGAFVKVCYKGTLENGVVFDKTDKCKPLEIQVGDGAMLKGFENALIGMGLNERRSFILDADEAYGERDERLERRFEKSTLQLGFEPFPGQVIVFMTQEGRELPALVKFIDDEVIVADFNHPLAGRQLAFEVEVAEIVENNDYFQSPCEAECCCA